MDTGLRAHSRPAFRLELPQCFQTLKKHLEGQEHVFSAMMEVLHSPSVQPYWMF